MKILVVDDDRFSQKLIARFLKDQYTVISAFDGNQGIALAQKHLPDSIILDVEMPGLNGFAVCDELKHRDTTKHIPIVFLSGCGSVRERMQGFESGADDYLVKPIDSATLRAKLKVLIKYRDQQRELLQQCKVAQKTAYIAMTGSSELGLAIRFITSSHNIKEYSTLASALFNVTDMLGLECTLMLLENNQVGWYSSNLSPSPLEKELLALVREDKKIIDFGCRTIVNYPSVSMLIKNMPIDNTDRYGRIKDLVPFLLDAINEKVYALETNKTINDNYRLFVKSVGDAEKHLQDLKAHFKANQSQGAQIMQGMIGDLNLHLPRMGLEEDQESYILDRVEQAIEQSEQVIDMDKKINSVFVQVIAQLHQISDQQRHLVQSIDTKQQIPEAENDTYLMDVELF